MLFIFIKKKKFDLGNKNLMKKKKKESGRATQTFN